jgi:uncharacterized protein (TIGR03086 family)
MTINHRNYVKALFGFDAVVQRTSDHEWMNSSPCVDWSALDVLAHNIGMCRMITGFVNGEGASVSDHPEIKDPKQEWLIARDEVLEALGRKETLQIRADTPWGNLTIEKFLGIVVVDPLTHTFDLARAVGQEIRIDEALAAISYERLKAAGDSIRGEKFGSEIQTGENDSIVHKFIAVTGRKP